jgi:hypothetical protein
MDYKKFILNDMDVIELFNFPLDELFELEVNHNNVKYEFLIRFSSNNKNMICFGSGAYNPKKYSPPVYNRHTWQSEFEESVLYYNDPTLYNNPKLTLGWGVGKNEEWYLSVMAEIIHILAKKNDIKPKNMLFFGSSGGGFTSIILSTLFKNSSAIVNNPQLFLSNYWKSHFDNMINSCFDNLELKTILTEYKYRFDVIELFKLKENVPHITYLVNKNSKEDLTNQLIPFINGLASLEHFNDQLNILLYSAENGHDGVVGKTETIKLIKKNFEKKEKFHVNLWGYEYWVKDELAINESGKKTKIALKEYSQKVSNYLLIEQKNTNTFTFTITDPDKESSFAWYIMKKGEMVEKFWYTHDPVLKYQFKKPGEYKIKYFVKKKEDFKKSYLSQRSIIITKEDIKNPKTDSNRKNKPMQKSTNRRILENQNIKKNP